MSIVTGSESGNGWACYRCHRLKQPSRTLWWKVSWLSWQYSSLPGPILVSLIECQPGFFTACRVTILLEWWAQVNVLPQGSCYLHTKFNQNRFSRLDEHLYQPASLVGLKLRVPSRLLRYRRIWSVPGNDELTQSRLEVSTLLAAGDKTHSQLLELMPERSGNAHTRNFEQVLKEVNWQIDDVAFPNFKIVSQVLILFGLSMYRIRTLVFKKNAVISLNVSFSNSNYLFGTKTILTL